jgi:TyrR family helix-turn-helix protein
MKRHFSSEAIQILMSYAYPGNVRELSNIVEQAFLISKGDIVEVDELPFQVRNIVETQGLIFDGGNKTYNEIVDLMEYKVLKNALEKYGSTHKMAKNLKISQSTISRKMKRLNIKTRDNE